MKPDPRIRKTIKWGGAAVTVLLAVVWIGSEWWGLEYSTSHWTVDVLHGRVGVMRWVSEAAGIGSTGWQAHATWSNEWEWWYEQIQFVHVTGVHVPGWWFVLAVGTPTAIAWRLDTLARRRAKLNLCTKCGYDRTGIMKDAKCPECGATPASV